MKKPDIPQNEKFRLQELKSYDIIGELEQKEFDFLTRMAAEICDAKISLISLVTEDKQWFLSHHGLETRETSKEYSFCAHAINTPKEPFIVEDARKDERFHDNPLVTGHPNVIFYAGIPLVNEQNAALGSICVIDDTPHTLSEKQLESLQMLKDQTIKLLELRRFTKWLKEKEQVLQKREDQLEIVQSINNIGVWELDLDTGETVWSDEVYRIHEVDKDFDHNKTNGINFYHPDDRSRVQEAIETTLETGEPFDLTARFITAKDNFRWVRSSGHLLTSDGNEQTLIGAFQDITDLKESEQKYQGIFNSSFSLIAFLNPEGKLLKANETSLQTAGISRDDVIGKKFWNCYWWKISKYTQRELQENIRKVGEGEKVTYEVEVWSENKTPLTILFSMRPVINAFGTVTHIIAEGHPVQEIVDARNRYRAVIEGTKAGTYEWNINAGQVLLNDRFLEIVGYTRNELEPATIRTMSRIVHPDDLNKSQDLVIKCFKKEQEYFQQELRLRHKSGDWIWVNVRGKIIEWSSSGRALKMYGTHQEITDRKRIENALQEERVLLRTIIDSVPDSIYVKDTEGRKLIANKIDCIYSGVEDEEELIGKTDFDIYPDEIAQSSFDEDRRVLENGEQLLNKEVIAHKPSGEKVWLLTSKIPLYNSDGEISGLVGIGRDITARKKAENVREELLNRFERIGQQIPGVIYQFRLYPDGSSEFPYASSGIKKIYGVTADEVSDNAAPAFEAIHPDDFEHVSNSISESAEKLTQWHDIYRVNLPDDKTIWVEGNATPQELDDGSVLWHGFIQDITERKKAEDALRYNKNLLEALYDLSPIGIALNDYETGKYIDVNDKLLEPSEYTKEELFNLSYWDLTPKEYQEEEEKALRQMKETGRYGPFEKEYIRKDGGRYPIMLRGVVVEDLNGKKLIWSFVEDTTLIKEAERKLKDALSSLQAVLDASTQVSIIATDKNGTITRFNKGAEQMLKYSADEVEGKYTPQFIHVNEEVEQKASELEKETGRKLEGFDVFSELAKQDKGTTSQWSYVRKDGSTFPILLSLTAICREDETAGYLGVATDITQLEKAREELRLLLSITEKQNDRLKNFAHIVSHNLRNHSQGITGFLDILESDYPDIYANECVQYINKAANNLEETILNLTEIVEKGFAEKDDLAKVNLKKRVDQTLHSLTNFIDDHDVEINVDVDDDIHLMVIPAYLDSIILNFLTNGIKYSDPEKESYVKVSAFKKDENIQLVFEDNGLGIDLERHGNSLFGMHNTFHDNVSTRPTPYFVAK